MDSTPTSDPRSSPDEERLTSRRAGMWGLLVGMCGAAALGFYAPAGDRSVKVNSTLFVAGFAGILIVALHRGVDDLSQGDRLRAGALFGLSISVLFLVDYGASLVGGQVATPLLVALTFVALRLVRSRREP